MTKRAREILDFYRSENAGVLSNLARMINHGRLAGTGSFVILPVDQGFEHGPARSFAPNPAGYDPRYHFSLACDAGCNAYAAPLGFLEAGEGPTSPAFVTALKEIGFIEGVNVAILRPGKQRSGIHPRNLPRLEGRPSTRDIPVGDGIRDGDWL